jgi:hypothetical protein
MAVTVHVHRAECGVCLGQVLFGKLSTTGGGGGTANGGSERVGSVPWLHDLED